MHLGVCRNENDRQVDATPVEFVLEFETAHAGHAQVADNTAFESLQILLDEAPADVAARAALGVRLGAYRFDRYRTKEKPEKKPSMVRNLRAIFARALLNEQEVRTLRGVTTALSRGRGRVLAKLAAQKAAKDKD